MRATGNIPLLALTSLPDDCLFIPLGVIRYNLFKTLVPCVAGKVLMYFILVMGGRLSIAFIRNLLGGDEGLLGIIATMALIIFIMVNHVKD